MTFNEAVMTGKPIRLPCSAWAYQVGVNWWMYMPDHPDDWKPDPTRLDVKVENQYPEVDWAGTYEGRPYLPKFDYITDNDWQVLDVDMGH